MVAVAVGAELGAIVCARLGIGEAGASVGCGISVEQPTNMKVMKVRMSDFLKVAFLILSCAFR